VPEAKGIATPGVAEDVNPPAPSVARNLTGAGASAPASLVPATPEPAPNPARLHVILEVVHGDITQVKVPVAVVGRYDGLPARGAAKCFDDQLDSWISRAIEYGMIGSDLGQLYCIPLPRQQTKPGVAPETLIVAGQGEPGRFTRDALRFLMTNVTLAVKALGMDELSAPLLGFSRGELPLNAIVRGMLEGVADGLDRFATTGSASLRLKLVQPQAAIAANTHAVAKGLAAEQGVSEMLLLEVEPKELELPPGQDSIPHAFPADLPTQERSTRITITSSAPTGSGVVPATDGTLVFQYAALGETATIPVRETEVQTYFASRLPGRLISSPQTTSVEACRKDQQNYGRLLMNYLIPEDFQRLIEAGDPLTLVLDTTTACYPWEMAGFKGHRDTWFFGTHLKVARQFRTLLSAVPGIAPPVNDTLKVLVIADPAPGLRHLKGARKEGQDILDVFQQAKDAWGQRLKLEVTVRIGAYAERDQPEMREVLQSVRVKGSAIVSVEPCDPLEILALLVNVVTEPYDIVHFAGHGVFDPQQRRMGWVFDDGCVLSAAEIFRVRQVPRLVFANACHSAVTTPTPTEVDQLRRQQVGLAEAFFARGIENYIGTGWQVDDDLAVQFATHFYKQVLGLPSASPDQIATLGTALASARQAILHQGSTWGAYQHYGQGNAKLVALEKPDEGNRRGL
jgi:hypothetical protein